METTIAYERTFCAAHCLCYHQGKCQRVHGHTYRLRVYVTGEPKTTKGDGDYGMLMDFAQLRRGVDHIIQELDHQMITSVWPSVYPTAELLAEAILKRLPFASAVRLYESDHSFAEVKRDD